jgi:hypothetical protein
MFRSDEDRESNCGSIQTNGVVDGCSNGLVG